MTADFMVGLVTGLVIGGLVGTFWGDAVVNFYYRVVDNVPSRDDVFGEDGLIRRHRTLVVVVSVVFVLALIVGGVVYYLTPQKTVGIGSTVSLADGCGSYENVTITQTHVDQGFVQIGGEGCEIKYPLTAKKPK